MPMQLGRWIEFLKIDPVTITTLRDFSTEVVPHMDRVMDAFYARIITSNATKLFKSPQHMERARTAQRNHWLKYVLSGHYDAEYMAAARAIGQAHHRLGVDLMLYSGAYSVVMNELSSIIVSMYSNDTDKTQDALHAVNKAIFLDMGLAISVYYDSFVSELEEMSNEVNFSLARAGEFRDNETGMHLLRMSRMCEALALAIGQDLKWAKMIQIASPLHDVGKIGIPDTVLLKPGRLNPEELTMMRHHPEIGGKIIPNHSAEVIKMAKRISLTHHERWDGMGYPAGLQGTEIPLEGRIAAICDVFDALLSERPYKKPWSIEEARSYLQNNKGTHFDPDLVTVFLENLPKMQAIRAKYVDDPAEVPAPC